MKRLIPQFFVVNYARTGGETRIGWFSRRVPGAGMAYFGFSDRGLAERFAATVELDHPKSATIGGGKWLPTFLGYPELRRQLEAGCAQRSAPVTLLAIDTRSFEDPIVHAARTDLVIQALAANSEADSGIEVEFEPYSNAASTPLPAPIDILRTMPVGEACLMPIHKPPAPVKTAWVLRRSDAQIVPIRRHPDCKNLQRAIRCKFSFPITGVEVRLVAVAIAMGFEPFTPESISAAFINEYDPVCHGLLENFTSQDRTPILLVGDSEPADFIAEGENALKQFARKSLAEIASMPPWTRSDFARCVDLFKRKYPTKLALWERLGECS